MATTTTNYGFEMPDKTDYYNITGYNETVAEIDSLLEIAQENYQAALDAAETATEMADDAAVSAAEGKNYYLLSESWAVGGTGIRDDEDTDNAKYYATTVAQETIDDTIADLAFGGRNLLLDTQDMSDWYRSSSSVITLVEDAEGFAVATWTTASSRAYTYIASPWISIEAVKDREITLSFWYKSDDYETITGDSSARLIANFRFNTSNASISGRTMYFEKIFTSSVTDEWQHYKLTVTVNSSTVTGGSSSYDFDDQVYFGVAIYNYTLGPLEVKKIKLEVENTASDWSPAPEDLMAYTDTVAAETLASAEEYTDTQLTNYSTTEEVDTGLQELANEIATVSENLSLITIGGTNLIPGTSDEWREASISTYYTTIYEVAIADLDLASGDTLMYSGWIQVPEDNVKTVRGRLEFYTSSSTRTSTYSDIYVAPGEESYFAFGTVLTDTYLSYTTVRACITSATTSDTSTETIYYKKFKFEEGNIPTDWSPAPEDKQDAISFDDSEPSYVDVNYVWISDTE